MIKTSLMMEVNLSILVNRCLIIIVGYVMSITAEWSPGSEPPSVEKANRAIALSNGTLHSINGTNVYDSADVERNLKKLGEYGSWIFNKDNMRIPVMNYRPDEPQWYHKRHHEIEESRMMTLKLMIAVSCCVLFVICALQLGLILKNKLSRRLNICNENPAVEDLERNNSNCLHTVSSNGTFGTDNLDKRKYCLSLLEKLAILCTCKRFLNNEIRDHRCEDMTEHI